MYAAFLSYAQLKEYLSVLIDNNLIEYSDGTQTFKTTEKGLNYIKMYREIGELLQQTTAIKNRLINLIFFDMIFIVTSLNLF